MPFVWLPQGVAGTSFTQQTPFNWGSGFVTDPSVLAIDSNINNAQGLFERFESQGGGLVVSPHEYGPDVVFANQPCSNAIGYKGDGARVAACFGTGLAEGAKARAGGAKG